MADRWTFHFEDFHTPAPSGAQSYPPSLISFSLDLMRASILLLLITASCFGGAVERDGSSFEKTILLPPGLADEVRWEMVQAHKLHPDANLDDAEQGLVSHDGRMYDVYGFHTSNGKKITMFFDMGHEENARSRHRSLNCFLVKPMEL